MLQNINVGIFSFLGLVSLLCLIHLWRKDGGLAYKLIWSVLVLIPLVGPLFYGGFYDPPSIKPGHEQQSNESSIHFHA
jgi:hypothetical protein